MENYNQSKILNLLTIVLCTSGFESHSRYHHNITKITTKTGLTDADHSY